MTVPDEAVEAAISAMETVTPPPGVSKSDWLKKHGPFALIAGAIAAAAPFIAAQAWDAAVQYADDQGCLLYHEAKGIKSHNPYRSEQ